MLFAELTDPSLPYISALAIVADSDLAKALPMRISPVADGYHMANNFTDDIISSFIHFADNKTSLFLHAITVAFETFVRPIASKPGHLPRDNMMSLDKLSQEGTPSDNLTILGWIVNTSYLEASLPRHKRDLWILDTKVLLHSKVIQFKLLEQLIGKLNHAAAIIPMTRNFLAPLRDALGQASQFGYTSLSQLERHTLLFWELILIYAGDGISLNLLSLRMPNQICIADACSHGMGGFSCNSGRAWQFSIPTRLQNKRHINFLEFLSCITTQLLEIFENRSRPGDCFLGQGDNTTSMGWLHHSNFTNPNKSILAGLSQYYVRSIIANKVCTYSQWIARTANNPAYMLS